MASYFVIGNTFRPYSFDELIKPYQIYGQAYREQEAAIDAAEKQRFTDSLAPGSLAESMYNTAEGNLRAVSDELATKGLTANLRGRLRNAAQEYSSTMGTLNTAAQKQQALQGELRKARLSNPTLLVQNESNIYDLDNFLTNPETTYGNTYSGALLAQQTSEAAKNLAKTLQGSDETAQQWKSRLQRTLPYQYRYLEQRGFTPEDVQAAIMSDRGLLSDIVEGVIESSGIKDWNNPEALNSAYQYAKSGLWSAVGTSEWKNISDSYSMQAALKSMASTSTGKGTTTAKPSFIDRTIIAHTVDREKSKNYLNERGELSIKGVDNTEIFNKDGYLVKPDDRGRTKYISSSPSVTGGTFTAQSTEYPATDAYNDIVGILKNQGYNDEQISKMKRKDVEGVLSAVYSNQANDIIGRNVYRLQIDDNATKLVMDKINVLGDNDSLRELTSIENGTPKYKDTKKKDIDRDAGMSILYSPELNTLLMQQGGKYYEIPYGVLSTSTYRNLEMDFAGLQEMQDRIDLYSNLIGKGYTSDYIYGQYQQAVDNATEYDARISAYLDELVRYKGAKNITD